MRIVIAGNGPSAISAIEAIREADRASEIIVISKENLPAYTPCFLYHYISGEITKDKLLIREEDFYSKNDVNLISGVHVKKVLPEKRTVLLSDERGIEFDRLLIATGSEPLKPAIPGIEGGDILFFKTLQDAERIISIMGRIKKGVVIGGGFIGLEIAEALRKKGLLVTVVEREKRILPRMLDEEMAGIVKDHLSRNGIDILIDKRVIAIERKDGRITGIKTETEEIPCDLVIVATGVRPNISAVEGSGIKTDRGIVVNEKMETNIPGIYAAGDVAELEIKGIRKVNPILSNAILQGRIAGSNIAGISKRMDSHLPDMNLINLFGLYIFSAGTSEGERVIKREDPSGIKKLILNEDNQLRGIQIIGPASLKGGVYLSILGKKVKDPLLLLNRPYYGMTMEGIYR